MLALIGTQRCPLAIVQPGGLKRSTLKLTIDLNKTE